MQLINYAITKLLFEAVFDNMDYYQESMKIFINKLITKIILILSKCGVIE